eukprot:g7160.t1
MNELDLEEQQLQQQLQQQHHVAQQQQQQQAYTLYCPDESFRKAQMNFTPGCCGFFATPWRGTDNGNAGAPSSSSHVDWRPVGLMPAGAAVFTNPLQLYPVHPVVNPYPTTLDSLPSVPEIQHPSVWGPPEARGATDYGARTGAVDKVDVGVQTQPILVRSGLLEPTRSDHESGGELRLVEKNTFLSLEEKEKAGAEDTFLSLSADGRKRRRPRSLPPSK